MKKLFLTSACCALAIGLAACGDYDEERNYDANAAYNAEDTNYTDNAADYNLGDTNDMNGVDNATDNTTGNATGNAAIDNGTGNSY